MHSDKLNTLQSNNTAFGETALSKTALSKNTLSDYQKATLQTMGIPLYERREGISLFDFLSQPSEALADSAASTKGTGANSVLDIEHSDNHVADESDDHVTDKSVTQRLTQRVQKEQKRLELIDESNDFIKQVLSVFAVDNTAELGLIWQVHDSEIISLEDNALITPDPRTLTAAISKKQLWRTLESHFKGQGWS